MGKIVTRDKILKNESSAFLRSVRISPRKLNLVAGVIRGMGVDDALTQLRFSRKAVSREVLQCLSSAIANAENNHDLDVDRLYVSEVLVGKGLVMKRIQARARGRAFRVHKPFSNIKIVVREREEEIL